LLKGQLTTIESIAFKVNPLFLIYRNNQMVMLHCLPDGLLAFASQINALLTIGKHQPNRKRICDYLASGWFCNNDGETFFQGIKEFLPGYYMFYTPENSLITQNFCHYPKRAL